MEKNTPLLKLKNVSKFYYNKGQVASGFTKINLELNLGEFVAITGESGSGKSTLLHVISGLDSYEEGEMYINGEETSHYSEEDAENYRKTYVGNIFQSFNLVNSYTVYQNIELVLLLNGYKKKDVKDKVLDLINKVGLNKYKRSKVSHLSGGQKQRVAIARALAKETPIIIADEPTGNLDSRSAASIMKLLKEISEDKLVVIVTHNYEQVEEYATRKIEMHDGKIREDIILKKTNTLDAKLTEYKDISFGNLIRLSFRNTFNIFHKFLLTFVVFIFLILAFLFELASFKEAEFEESSFGYNWNFRDLSSLRMIASKKDKSILNDTDKSYLESLPNIDHIDYKDIMKDKYIDVSIRKKDSYEFDYWSDYNILTFNKVPTLTYGTLPLSDNEFVIETRKDNSCYYENPWIESELESKYNIIIGDTEYNDNFILKGIIYNDNLEYCGTNIYLAEKFVNKAYQEEIQSLGRDNATLNMSINNAYFDFVILASDKIKKGEVIIPESYNYYCGESCKNKTVDINYKSSFYEHNLKLNIVNEFNSKNVEKLTGLKYRYDEFIYISFEDYNEMFKLDTYQASIYVKEAKDLEKVKNNLTENGYNVFIVKDTLVSDLSFGIYKILKLIVTTALFVALFFITYFIIKLIQKSKNIYYATIRILGGSQNVIKKLIRYELLIMCHLTYSLSLIFFILVRRGVFDFPNFKTLIGFLGVSDYILLYVLVLAISILIASRYSRSLFKSSAMKSYREEV